MTTEEPSEGDHADGDTQCEDDTHRVSTSDGRSTTEESVIRRDRFSGGPARSFLSSMAVDDRIFAADLAVDRAHVIMLAECDVIDEESAADILQALAEVEQEGYAALPVAEDVHEAIETAVVDRVGPAGGRMHTARSRNDEVATCIRYRLREDLLDAIEATIALRTVLIEVAQAHTETVMPGYTHLQPAQPITVAHWALSYEGTIRRDTARLFDAYERVNRSPLGAAAFAGTPFDIDRTRTATLLGFDGLVENAMDAASSRDVALEAAGSLLTAATTLSGLAADVILFANRGFVELSDEYSSTSSIMPQKKNPDTLELVRAATGDAAAGFTGLQSTLKGLPRAYNRDLQRATPHVWQTVDAVTEALSVAAGAVSTADWDEETLATEAGSGFSTATGVADRLADCGVPFRQAHEVVAQAALELDADEPSGAMGDTNETLAADETTDDSDVSTTETDAHDRQSIATQYEAIATATEAVLGDPIESYVSRSELEAVLDPAKSVTMRNSTGGPAPEAATAQLESAHEALAMDEKRLAATRESVSKAAEKLTTEVAGYV